MGKILRLNGKDNDFTSNVLMVDTILSAGNGSDIVRLNDGALNCTLDGGRGVLDEAYASISIGTTFKNFELVSITDGGSNTILGGAEVNQVSLLFTSGDVVSVGAGNDAVSLGNCDDVQISFGDGNDTLLAIGCSGLVADGGVGNDSFTSTGSLGNNQFYLGTGTNVLKVAPDAIGGTNVLGSANVSEGACTVLLSTELSAGAADMTAWQFTIVGAGADDTLIIDGVEYAMNPSFTYTNVAGTMSLEIFFS